MSSALCVKHPATLGLTALTALSVLAACSTDASSSIAPILDPNLANLGSMEVGDVRVLTFSQAQNGLTIPASLSSAQYVVVAANATVNSDVVPQLTINADWLAPPGTETVRNTVLAPSSLSAAPALTPTFTQTGGPRGAQVEAHLRNFERTRLPLGARTVRTGLQANRTLQVPSPAFALNPAVGDQISGIKTLTASGSNPCMSYITTTGTVKAVTNHAIIVLDNRSVNNGLSDSDYQAIASEFDTVIYPTDVSYFGTPSDRDGNGRITIYYTPSVNQLTPPGEASTTGYVGGFFFAGDLFDVSACPSSNKSEIFYLLAPDPTAQFGNTFSAAFVRQVTRGTVAHEFQHMINAGTRYMSDDALSFESTWLDEGLAHFAEDAVGRAETGLGGLQTISFAEYDAMSSAVQNAFFNQNFLRAKSFILRPDTTGAIVSRERAGHNLASRGAEWLLLRYAADWFSNDNPQTLTRALASGPDTGTTNLARQIAVPLDTLFAHWLVTLYTDHQNIANLKPQYNYRSYTMRALLTDLTSPTIGQGYLPVTAIGDGQSVLTTGVPGSSGAYFLTSKTTGGARTITVSSGSAAVLGSKGRFYVVRTQ